jgi:hypothetical protein
MGETVRHIHKIDEQQFAAFVEAISAPYPAPAESAHARTPYDVGLEPWTFHSPSHGGDVMAYIDDRNQVRHVPTTRTSEVPKAWRRIWIEAPA